MARYSVHISGEASVPSNTCPLGIEAGNRSHQQPVTDHLMDQHVTTGQSADKWETTASDAFEITLWIMV